MKKMFAAAALLGLASAVFGQTAPSVTLGGGLYAGVAAQTNGKDKAQIGIWDDNDFKPAGRFKLTGKADVDGNGVAFDIRADGLTQGTNTLILKSVYVYANYLDKLLSTQVGIISENSIQAKGDMAISFTKEVPGAVLLVKPAEGLALQLALVKPFDSAGTSGYGGMNFTNLSDAPSVIGASYTMAGTAIVLGQVYVSPANGKYTMTQFQAGLGVTAVPSLGLWVELYSKNLNGATKNSITTIDEKISYDLKDSGLDGMMVGLNSYQGLYGDDLVANASGDKVAISYLVQPWVSTKLDGGATAKFAVGYLAGADSGPSGNFYSLTNGVLDPIVNKVTSMEGTDFNKIATLTVNPSISLPLGKGQTMVFGVNYTMSVGSDKLSFLNGSTGGANSLTTILAQYNFAF